MMNKIILTFLKKAKNKKREGELTLFFFFYTTYLALIGCHLARLFSSLCYTLTKVYVHFIIVFSLCINFYLAITLFTSGKNK